MIPLAQRRYDRAHHFAGFCFTVDIPQRNAKVIVTIPIVNFAKSFESIHAVMSVRPVPHVLLE
jgi:hypothetical protein